MEYYWKRRLDGSTSRNFHILIQWFWNEMITIKFRTALMFTLSFAVLKNFKWRIIRSSLTSEMSNVLWSVYIFRALRSKNLCSVCKYISWITARQVQYQHNDTCVWYGQTNIWLTYCYEATPKKAIEWFISWTFQLTMVGYILKSFW